MLGPNLPIRDVRHTVTFDLGGRIGPNRAFCTVGFVRGVSRGLAWPGLQVQGGAVESLRRLGLEARNRRMANIICPCDIGQDLSCLSPNQSLPPLMG